MKNALLLRHLFSSRHSGCHVRNDFLDLLKSRRFLLPPVWILMWILAATSSAQDLQYGSSFLRVQMAVDQPNFKSFSVDSLGKSKLGLNVMLPLAEPGRKYEVSHNGNSFEYRARAAIAQDGETEVDQTRAGCDSIADRKSQVWSHLSAPFSSENKGICKISQSGQRPGISASVRAPKRPNVKVPWTHAVFG